MPAEQVQPWQHGAAAPWWQPECLPQVLIFWNHAVRKHGFPRAGLKTVAGGAASACEAGKTGFWGGLAT